MLTWMLFVEGGVVGCATAPSLPAAGAAPEDAGAAADDVPEAPGAAPPEAPSLFPHPHPTPAPSRAARRTHRVK